MIYQNILDAMGHTPMVQLNRMVPEGAARVLVKYEGEECRRWLELDIQQQAEKRF